MKTPFGELDAETVASIKSLGGMYTREGREWLMLHLVRQYLKFEEDVKTPAYQAHESLFRVMARILVECASGASENNIVRSGERNVSVIVNDLLGFLSQSVDEAMTEYRQLCASGKVRPKQTETHP